MNSVVRVLTWKADVDGRAVLLASVACYLAAIAAGRLIWGVDLWPLFGVPSGPSLFFDARNLTAAWECDRLGYDPLYENPCDPHGRPLMYLRPWLLLGVLGLDQSHTVLLSVVLIACLFLSFTLLVGRIPAGTGVVLAVAACSPAVMFAVERANMDVALFSVVAASVLLWRFRPAVGAVVSPVLVLLASMAKIYPVFALAGFLAMRTRTAALTALLCTGSFAAYVLYNLRDVAHVAEIAVQGEHFSYGARILLAHIYHQIHADRWPVSAALKQAVAIGIVSLAVAAFLWLYRRAAFPCVPVAATASLLAFYSGALIYLGTFAVANNFDYRLVFVLLTLPQLVAWASARASALSTLAATTLGALLLLLWVGCLSGPLRLWDELASWTAALLLVALTVPTVPRWPEARTMIAGLAGPPGRA